MREESERLNNSSNVPLVSKRQTQHSDLPAGEPGTFYRTASVHRWGPEAGNERHVRDWLLVHG